MLPFYLQDVEDFGFRSCHKMVLDPVFRQLFVLGRYVERTLRHIYSEFLILLFFVYLLFIIINISFAVPKLFIFGSGSTFVRNFGSGSSSSSCHIPVLTLKPVPKQWYYKKCVSMEVFLHPCILQTDCREYLFKR